MAEATALLLESEDPFGFSKFPDGVKEKATLNPPEKMEPGSVTGTGRKVSSRDDASTKMRRIEDLDTFKAGEIRDRTSSHPDSYGNNVTPRLMFSKRNAKVGNDSTDEADFLSRANSDAPDGKRKALQFSPSAPGSNVRRDESRANRPVPAISLVETGHRFRRKSATSRRRSPSPPLHGRRGEKDSPQPSPRHFLTARSLSPAAAQENASKLFPELPERTETIVHDGSIDGVALSGGHLHAIKTGVTDVKDASVPGMSEGAKLSSQVHGDKAVHLRSLKDDGDGDGSVSGAADEGSQHEGSVENSPLAVPDIDANDIALKSHSQKGEAGKIQEERSTGHETPAIRAPPMRSALAGSDKTRSAPSKSRGVTFDDDVKDLDALAILPSSDDDSVPAMVSPVRSLQGTEVIVTPAPFAREAVPSISEERRRSATLASDTNSESSEVAPNQSKSCRSSDRLEHQRRRSTATLASLRSGELRPASLTAGLSPAAARAVDDDSSGEELRGGEDVALKSCLGLDRTTLSEQEKEAATADDAKLDLALGFSPSSMEGSRRQRRIIPRASERQRRPGVSPMRAHESSEVANSVQNHDSILRAEMTTMSAPRASQVSVTTRSTPGGARQREMAGLDDHIDLENESTMSPINPVVPIDVSISNEEATQPQGTTSTTDATQCAGKDSSPKITMGKMLALVPTGGDCSPTEKAESKVGRALGTPGKSSVGKEFQPKKPGDNRGLDVEALSCIERQLVILTRDREAAASQYEADKRRLEQEVEEAGHTVAAAESRAREIDIALVAAR